MELRDEAVRQRALPDPHVTATVRRMAVECGVARSVVSTVVFDRDLDIALRCSGIAAGMALEYYAREVRPELKSDGSPVTDADCAVEDRLRKDLESESPGDAILGEESGLDGNSHRMWILDPIDGRTFARGDPHWRVQVVLQTERVFTAAVITAPAIGRQWWAVRGGGAFESAWPRHIENAKRLAVSSTNSVAQSLLAGDSEPTRRRLSAIGRVAPTAGGGWCAGLVDLVRGTVDCLLSEGHKVWDHAPWRLLVEEAGGRFTKQSDSEIHGGGLYSNNHLHECLLEAIGYGARAQ